ncbi:hypothetical protein FOXB_11490 [Fusarium oxysporum f. sp. conglutinans Fo5176]|uniref:Mitochondrial distribution and morphology protein 35 n=1 Tax=Fusarium oxysporum (strain Fo5176) TaxID=660025 RepID=F9FYK8_FUSOF|nr:hypothetical protein FOXB_11490 [Fusarium oxysporum f. sp. conglutinans Fo5176]
MSASLAPECNEVKERYDTCFLKWYSEKYLRGQEKDNKECADMFKEYQNCLKNNIYRVLDSTASRMKKI